MKVVIAMDSLKGSLSSREAGEAARNGLLKAMPDAEVIVKPIADGGEGTTEALIDALGGERVELTVMGPYGEPTQAVYGYVQEERLAVMEMAAASGITLSKRREPLEATSFGVGQMIRDAIGKGCRNFIIGIGGSATNDGGIGMLSALGVKFLDKEGKAVGQGAGALAKVETVLMEEAVPELERCRFRIACDVNNPLCGEQGCTYIFGLQKGVTESIKEQLDADMSHFADVTAKALGKDERNVPGAGAAGGLGFAFLSYLKGELQPGIQLIRKAIGLEECVKDADLVVTGEGCLDDQTIFGKTPVGVAECAKKAGVPVIAFAGGIRPGAQVCNEKGIDAYFAILPGIMTLGEAMEKETARANMMRTVEQVFRLIAAVRR